jgi:hypothetical protein
MKRRYIAQRNDEQWLICRARCHPPRRRNPIETPLLRLQPEEVMTNRKGRLTLAEAGRFAQFAHHALPHRAHLEGTNKQITDMIDWINERNVRWSFELIGEQRLDLPRLSGKGPKAQVSVHPCFSFDNDVVAVEFKLTHG